MKPKQHTYVDPDDYLGDDENERQDATVEARFADKCSNAVPATWTAPTTITACRIGAVRLIKHHLCPDPGGGLSTVLDNEIDWRDRYMDRGWICAAALDSEMPGGDAYVTPATIEVDGYTGKGANAGAPPALIGVGTAGVGEYWTLVANLYLYVTGAGALEIMNATGADVYVWGVLGLTGDIGGF